jgi:hypothetical protein
MQVDRNPVCNPVTAQIPLRLKAKQIASIQILLVDTCNFAPNLAELDITIPTGW